MTDPAAAPVERAPDPARPLRLLVVDDHEVVHWGFRLMLGAQPWVERCLAARSGDEALALGRRYEPHVALVDLFVGPESGAELCGRLLEVSPRTRVLLISGAGRISERAARAAGAAGFVAKDSPATELADAVKRVAHGDSAFSAAAPAPPPLSGREREVLQHIAAGATNPEIGRALHLSPHTVKEHTSSLYRRLGVRGRTEAVREAQRLGLLD